MFDRLKTLYYLLLPKFFPYDPREDIRKRRINREEVEKGQQQVLLLKLESLEQER